MSILVTGGAGYIGSHLVWHLIKEKGVDPKEIYVIDSLVNGSEKNLPKGINFQKIDLLDKGALERFFQDKEFEKVFHFAALISVPESMENPKKYFENNVVGTLNLVDIASKHGLKVFIFSSTAAVYGNVKGKVNENHSLKPESPYGASKLMAEILLEQYAKINKFSLAILRYFNVIGTYYAMPRNKYGLPYNLIKAYRERASFKIFGKGYNTKDGTAVRDYINVLDLVEAHYLASEKFLNKEEIVKLNLGSENGYTVLEVVNTFNEILEEKGLAKLKFEFASKRPGDVEEIVADASKANKILGWKPKRSLKESLTSLVEFAKNF